MYSQEQIQIMKFFALLFGKVDGGYVELRPTNFAGSPDMDRRMWIPANKQEKFAEAALQLNGKYHVYFGVATRSKVGKEKGRATGQYLKELPCLYADLDASDYEGGLAEARNRVVNFRLPPSIVINSGHGYHGYWLLSEPYDISRGPSKPKVLLKALQVKELGADPTYDLTRLLRVMNTTNIKDPDKLVLAKPHKLENIRYTLDELAARLPWEEVVEEDYDNRVEEGNGLVEGKYEGLDKVVNSSFIQYCRTHAVDLPEPLWYSMITNLIPFKGGRKKIHELSRPYPDYTYEETEAKIAHALTDAPGPHTVGYIEEHGVIPRDCNSSGVNSPAGLAFIDEGEEDNTEENGR